MQGRIMKLENKKVLVVGSGLSGIGAIELLKKLEAVPVLFEGNEKRTEAELREKLREENPDTQIIIGNLPEELVRTIDLVILSPGVPTDLHMVNVLRERGIPVWGEIELAFVSGKGQVLAITGTNGKTTTTSLAGEILRRHQEDIFVVGNIGTPYTGIALETTDNSLVIAELSSFQLETIHNFRPKVSAILNITPDHLDRHHTLEEYIRVKKLITKNQTEDDICILNYEDEVLREYGKTLHTNVLFFSSLRTLERGLYLENDIIYLNDGICIKEICKTKELKVIGLHNYENIMAAVGIALSLRIPLEEIIEVITHFRGVEHRIEYVTEKNGVTYYNDSKGTNPDAAIKGIQAMNRQTYLIAGGYDKKSSYEKWINAFDGKVKYLILIGQTRDKIACAAFSCGFSNIIFAETLEEAVHICAEKANPGEAVLLSPACASWGMFEDYEVRGKMFKEYVNKL